VCFAIVAGTSKCVIIQTVTFQPRFKFEPLMYVFPTTVAIMLWEEGTIERLRNK
jgi:hypothetical protein